MEENKSVCEKCGLCCKSGGKLYATKEEAERIACELGMSIKEFWKNYLIPMMSNRYIIKMSSVGACSFLDEDNHCIIYNVRPQQCKDFPFKWMRSDLIGLCSLAE